MAVLFGDKTMAWLDVWSLEHLIAGISAITIARYCNQKLIMRNADAADFTSLMPFNVIFVLFMAYGWESIEHYLEAGITGIESITYWFQGVEFWGNRLITDPLLMVCGGIIATKHSRLILPARIFSLIWLFVHIVLFPHSMYLHTLLE